VIGSRSQDTKQSDETMKITPKAGEHVGEFLFGLSKSCCGDNESNLIRPRQLDRAF